METTPPRPAQEERRRLHGPSAENRSSNPEHDKLVLLQESVSSFGDNPLSSHTMPPEQQGENSSSYFWSSVVRLFVILPGSLFLLTTLASPRASADEEIFSKEYQVKAAFLFNFTKFVEWPPGHFTSEDRAIVVGVMGRNPFGDEFTKAIKGRRVNGREVAVKFITGTSDAISSDLLFVCAGEESRMISIDSALHQAQVLTIGESSRFAEAGGMINFIIVDEKVHFAVNLDSVGQASLKLSGQLLKLALSVRRKT